jgi:hypothetical protein
VQRYNAIPTEYGGTRFRSRLEARWAAFFDALSWDWDYEPIDLDGYIPDFVLPFRYAPLLVEVKPALRLPAELHDHKQKITDSSWSGEALIVGSRLGLLKGEGDMLCGILGSREPMPAAEVARVERCRAGLNGITRAGDLEWLWDDGMLFHCVPCRGPSIAQYNGSWRCRRCGTDDGQQRGFAKVGVFQYAWLDAGNAVQWRRGQ